MDVAKLTVTRPMEFLGIAKGVTKNPTAKQVSKALDGARIEQMAERLAAPKLWDGSREMVPYRTDATKDIVDLAREKGMRTIHIMPQHDDIVDWGYKPTLSARIKKGMDELREKFPFEPASEDIEFKNCHLFAPRHDHHLPIETKAGGIGAKDTLAFKPGGIKDLLDYVQGLADKQGAKLEPVTQDIRFSHLDAPRHDRLSSYIDPKAGGFDIEG